MTTTKKRVKTKGGIYLNADPLPKQDMGVRPEFPYMPQAFNSLVKERSLHMLSKLVHGQEIMVKRAMNYEIPLKQYMRLESNKHNMKIAGCSIQFAMMCAMISRGNTDWVESL